MSEKFLLEPKRVIPETLQDRPVFFLAGPIRGGGSWQLEAAEYLWKKFPGAIVVDPTRWEAFLQETKDGEAYARVYAHRAHSVGVKDETLYPAQAPWESDHMKLAASKGVLLFWLPRQREDRPKDQGVYAQDTRVEIGIWIERLRWLEKFEEAYGKQRVLFGGEWHMDDKGKETPESFGGLNFIAYYLTGEKDRRKLYTGEVKHPRLSRACTLKAFIDEASELIRKD
jgi:hypothetical protein